MVRAIRSGLDVEAAKLRAALATWFFGRSKKQGTSMRMPLLTCQATGVCANACYAHDVLDAAPNAVVRGVLNGWIAEMFEEAEKEKQAKVLMALVPHTRRAVGAAISELGRLPKDFNRRAHIRFSHVGEIVRYPGFANALAEQVRDISRGTVDCVVYTRHQNVIALDRELWIINFTLDTASEDRRAWIPPDARVVYSAFDGELDSSAEVNFLEHHRWVHVQPAGTGRVCPATLPETLERTCDSVRCARCFTRPNCE
jgi:hypothetical protein